MWRHVVSILFSAVIIFGILQPAFSLDGTRWKMKDKEQRAFYVMGVVEAWADVIDLAKHGETSRLSAAEEMVKKVVTCMGNRGMKYAQIIAIVEKYIEDNPKHWNFSMASLVWEAMYIACK